MDGYVLIEVNTEGKKRVKEDFGTVELHFYDEDLAMLDWDKEFITDSIEGQLPSDLKDVLLMVHFSYQSLHSYNYDCGDEYEDVLNVETYTVVKKDYKEFYQQMVTQELSLYDIEPGSSFFDPPLGMNDFDERKYPEWLKANWEEFYDEDFVPFQPKVIDNKEIGFRFGK